MTRSPSLSDDDALWFPVMTSGSDSFSRPITPDGAPQDSADDGIGLPTRRGPGGPKTPGRPRKPGRATNWLWLTLWGAAALGIVTYAARKEIATVAIENWLRGQGVEAPHLKIDALSFGRASGQFYIGEEKQPELSIGRFDIDYSLQPFAGGGQPLARVKTIHLSRPLLQFSFKEGQLNFGSLDKLVQSALTAPPSDTAPPPDSIVIDDATVRVVTDYGLVRGQGGLALKQGQLIFARVELPGTILRGPLGSGELKRGLITAKSVSAPGPGDRLQIQARLEAADWEMRTPADPVATADTAPRPTNFQDIVVDIDSLLPYRKATSVTEAFSGPTEHTLALRAAGVQTPDADLAGLEVNLRLDGALKASDKGAAFTGKGRLLSRADSLMSGEIDSRGLTLEGQNLLVTADYALAAPLALTVSGPVTGRANVLRQNDLFAGDLALKLSGFNLTLDEAGLDADYSGGLTAGRVAVAEIALERITASLTGAAYSNAEGWGADIRSDVSSDHGSYTGLKAMAQGRIKAIAEQATKPPVPGAPNPPPPDAVVMLDRALSRFALRARGVSLTLNGTSQAGAPARFSLNSRAPIELALNGGGKAIVTPAGNKALLASSQSGGFDVALSGPDLPTVALNAAEVGLTDTGLVAGRYKLAADFDFYPLSGGHAEAQGRFATTSEAGVDVTLAQPATVTATSVVLGDHFTDVKLNLSQTGPAFLRLDNTGAFRVSGGFADLSMDAPNLLARLEGGKGPLEAYTIAGAEAVGLKLALDGLTFTDSLTGDKQRFNPLTVTGTLNNTARALTGRFITAAKGSGRKVADVRLDNDNITGTGALSFATADYLTFDPAGLQPGELSPLAGALFTRDVTGKADFVGAIAWDKTTASSGGTLVLDGLNFTGVTGASQGLNGKIVFTSLAPMLSDPGQVIAIDSMNVGVPLRDLRLSVQFQGEQIALESAQVQSPGGPLILEPTILPLDGTSAISGAVKFDGLDFGKVIAATELAGSMTFDGHLSGRLPFRIENGRLSFADGYMRSDEAGMISIKRTSVTDMTATGSVAATDPNAPPAAPVVLDPNFNPFQDLAFQAMEWLRYDDVSARLNSIPGGKLNINFHIKGRFSPPTPQKAKIGLVDYLTGKWMTQPIKLPSDTPVELYLEVPVNLDEILDDLGQFNARQVAR